MRAEREHRPAARFSDENILRVFTEVAPEEEADLAFAKAPKTILQYATAWRSWVSWCEKNGHEPMPVTAAALKGWVASLASEGKAPSTVDNYTACLSTIAHYRGYELPRVAIRERMKAIRRRGRPPRRAAPLVTDMLAKILELLDPADPRDARDGALLCVMFGAALRSSEATTLDWERFGPINAGGLGWVAFDKRGIVIELGRSKTSQITPVQLVIPDRDMPSAKRWLESWIEIARVKPGTPIFRPISRWGRIEQARIAAESVTDILKSRALDYARAKKMPAHEGQLFASRFTSHSCRRGYCTSASLAGLSLGEIRKRSRHSSDALLAGYINDAEGWRFSGLRGVGV
jgi:integrase